MDRSALLGLTTGAAVMFGFGCVWLLIGLLRGRPTPAWLRVSVLVAGIALGSSIATLGLRASRTPPSAIAATAQQREANRELGRHFYRVVAIEMMAIFLAVIVLNATHRPDYILCAIALIVGVHFLPLAHWFGLALYYGTGAVGCAIGLAGLFVADGRLRQTIVGISFGLLLWATAAGITWLGLT